MNAKIESESADQLARCVAILGEWCAKRGARFAIAAKPARSVFWARPSKPWRVEVTDGAGILRVTYGETITDALAQAATVVRLEPPVVEKTEPAMPPAHASRLVKQLEASVRYFRERNRQLGEKTR